MNSLLPPLLKSTLNRFRSWALLTTAAVVGVLATPSKVQATIVHSGVYDSLGSVGDYITLNFDGTPQVEVTSTAISSGSNVQFIVNSGSRGKGSRPPLLHVQYIGNVLFSESEVSVDDTINNSVSIANNSGWGVVGTATPAKKYYYAFSYNPSGDNLTYMYG